MTRVSEVPRRILLIDARLLAAMASQPEKYYYAPDAEDVAHIYAQVAVTIRCPAGRHDWGKPWP